uniref:Uncharacterized protein n=1 Tax=Arundo donax TaxID=35708 RepID=A0A0A9A5C7_ARUDO
MVMRCSPSNTTMYNDLVR